MDYFRPYLLPSAPLWVGRARAALRWRGGQVFSLRFCGGGDQPNQEVAHSSESKKGEERE